MYNLDFTCQPQPDLLTSQKQAFGSRSHLCGVTLACKKPLKGSQVFGQRSCVYRYQMKREVSDEMR